MKKILDKLKNKITINKKMITFLLILMIIGIITGSLLVALLNEADKILVKDYIYNFINKIELNQLNYNSSLISSLISNIGLFIIIWLLGISVIGAPIIIFIYFSKCFTLGFTIASSMLTFGFKGTLLSLIIILFEKTIYFIGIILLMIYALTLSIKLSKCLLKKETINFKFIINKYTIVLGISLLFVVISSICETFVVPKIISLVVKFIK